MERPTALFLTHTIPPLRKRWDLWAKYRAEHRWERPTSGHTSYNIWDEHNHTHSAAGVFCPKEPWPHWKPYKHISVCIHLLFFSGWCTLSLSHTHTHTHTQGEGFGVHLLLVNDITTGPLQGRLRVARCPSIQEEQIQSHSDIWTR